MKRLSKKQLERIERAIELLETNEEKYSCIALEYTHGFSSIDFKTVELYREFFNKANRYAPWFPNHTKLKQSKQARIMLLTVFAELYGKV